MAKLKVEIEKFIKFHINRSGSFLEKSHLGGEFPSRYHSSFLERLTIFVNSRLHNQVRFLLELDNTKVSSPTSI